MKETKTPASSLTQAPVKNTGGVTLAPPVIQAKLLVGHPDDPLEHEADRAAERVVSLWQGGSFGAPAGETPAAPPAAPLIQRRAASPAAGAVQAGPEVAQHIQSAQGGGQPLPGELLPPLEAAFGMDFSGVRLHTDHRADALNRELQARAFTMGQDIFFRQGEYRPGTAEGVRLLGHELGHVGQQFHGIQRIQRWVTIGHEVEEWSPDHLMPDHWLSTLLSEPVRTEFVQYPIQVGSESEWRTYLDESSGADIIWTPFGGLRPQAKLYRILRAIYYSRERFEQFVLNMSSFRGDLTSRANYVLTGYDRMLSRRPTFEEKINIAKALYLRSQSIAEFLPSESEKNLIDRFISEFQPFIVQMLSRRDLPYTRGILPLLQLNGESHIPVIVAASIRQIGVTVPNIIQEYLQNHSTLFHENIIRNNVNILRYALGRLDASRRQTVQNIETALSMVTIGLSRELGPLDVSLETAPLSFLAGVIANYMQRLSGRTIPLIRSAISSSDNVAEIQDAIYRELIQNINETIRELGTHGVSERELTGLRMILTHSIEPINNLALE